MINNTRVTVDDCQMMWFCKKDAKGEPCMIIIKCKTNKSLILRQALSILNFTLFYL